MKQAFENKLLFSGKNVRDFDLKLVQLTLRFITMIEFKVMMQVRKKQTQLPVFELQG